MVKKNTSTSITQDELCVDETYPSDDGPSRLHEIFGLSAALLALTSLLAILSFDGVDAAGSPVPEGNIIGPAGMWLAHGLFLLLGAGAYMLNLALWVCAGCLFTGRGTPLSLKVLVGAVVLVGLSSIALHTLLDGEALSNGHSAGGLIGTVLGGLGIATTSTVGTLIMAFGGILLTLLVITDISLFLLFRSMGVLLVAGFRWFADLTARIVHAWIREIPSDEEDASTVVQATADSLRNATAIEDDDKPTPAAALSNLRIVTPRKNRQSTKTKPSEKDDNATAGDYVLPSLDLLSAVDVPSANLDEGYLKQNAERLMAVLGHFDIHGEVKEIHPGPRLTVFEFQPTAGTRLSKIGSLANELAMALEVQRVRIVAPIPGKNAVGFELPNRESEMVSLREILEDEGYRKAKGALPMALGKDISGLPYTVDLARMPHLLMAGTTGSGKSVSVNTMLLSLLFRYTPDDLRLLLIDPKMIEFQPYSDIPHLLAPVVTDMSKANQALKWAVDEMEKRYQLFADTGAKNLQSYNTKVAAILADLKTKEAHPMPKEITRTDNGTVIEYGEREHPLPERIPERLPLIVICIDELADLMMVAAKEVEQSIARLAQKARAAGIHLIVATQRPSTDVVTGLIKSNFPARLSCQLPSPIDSRTILGTNGAESLLGNGDMLIIPPGRSDAVRLQGAFVSEEDVTAVANFLRSQRAPRYDEEILASREENADESDESEKDEVYDQAIAFVAEHQKCSISLLQRHLRIGYNRSARIVEIMEKEGVVGPANGSNKREVLISPL